MSNPPSASPALENWIGRQESRLDTLDLRQAQALAATLDYDPAQALASGELPPLWHWIYFNPIARRSELGPDGHPQRGGFLPPVELPNRMWAGGRFVFHRPLRLGQQAQRLSTIRRCERKEGRNGPLVFVTVHHAISDTDGLALEEEHDIVYRQPTPHGTPLAGEAAPSAADFRRRVQPDPVLLFRYSALTFNGHRIHYDHPYATATEGYPGLVFHGPLTATLLLEAFRAEHPSKTVRRFDYRAVGPLFDNTDFDVCGRLTNLNGQAGAALWTDCAGRVTMKAQVGL